MSVFNKLKKEKGGTLIEILIAMAILSILFSGVLVIGSPAFENAQLATQTFIAQQALTDKMEALRATRNQGWSILVPGSSYHNSFNTSSGWSLGSGTYTDAYGYTFNYSITIPFRQDNNTLLDTSSTYPQDNSARKIYATVTWTSYGKTRSISQTEYLTNWKPF